MYLYNIDKETVLIFLPLIGGSCFGPDSFSYRKIASYLDKRSEYASKTPKHRRKQQENNKIGCL